MSFPRFREITKRPLSSVRLIGITKTFGILIKIFFVSGPEVELSKKKIMFKICKNISEQRKETISIVNKTNVDTTYQWLLPYGGQGYFQVIFFQRV